MDLLDFLGLWSFKWQKTKIQSGVRCVEFDSSMEEVRDLRGSRVFSSRKLESSKLDPRLESEQEMHRDLRLAEKNI